MKSQTLSIRRLRGRIYYGWTMLLGLSLAEITSWGILYYGFSVFLTPMKTTLGWSTAALTGAYSLAILVSGIVAIPVGRWLDRRGPRLLMTGASCLAVLLVIAWSRVDSLPVFYLIWAGIGVTMACVLYEPAFYLVAIWFSRLRSRALTLLTFVGGFASVIYIPLAGWLIESYGWRSALLYLAGILAVGTIPIHALLLRRRPADLGLAPDGSAAGTVGTATSRVDRTLDAAAQPSATLRQALHDPGFWWLTASFVLVLFATVATLVHLIPFLIGQGYSASFAATAAGLVGLFGLPGRLIFTPLGSRIPRRYVTALIFTLQTASLVVLLMLQSKAGVLLFVALFGAGFGAITPARAALVAEFYGPENYGSISGVLALWVTLARAAAPVTTGLLLAMLHGYSLVFWLLAVVSAAAAVAALKARPRLHLAPVV